MMDVRRTSLPLLFLAPLAAQAPLMELCVDGPARWLSKLRTTNVAVFAESEHAAAAAAALRAAAHEAIGIAEVPASVSAFAGRFVVRAYVEPDPGAGEGRQRLRMRGLAFAEGGGELGALALDLMQLLPREGAQRSVVVDGPEGQLRGLRLEELDEIVFGLPMLRGGRLVSWFGSDAQWAVTAGLAELDALPAAELPPLVGARFELDIRRLLELVEIESGKPRPSERRMMSAFGVDAMQRLALTLRPEGPHLMLEGALELATEGRGILGAFLPAQEQAPERLGHLPPDTMAGAHAFAPMPFARTLLAIGAEFGAHGVDDARAEVRRELGFDILDDFAAHLGSEVIWVADPGSEAQEHADAGLCIAFSVADAKALAPAWNALFDNLSSTTEPEVSVRGGVEVRSYPVRGPEDTHTALAPTLAVFAFGDVGLATLHAFLDGERVRAAGDPPPPPPLLRRARLAAPDGWCGAAVLPFAAGARLPSFVLREVVREVLPSKLRQQVDVEVLRASLREAVPTLRRYNLDALAVMSGFADGWWRVRLLW